MSFAKEEDDAVVAETETYSQSTHGDEDDDSAEDEDEYDDDISWWALLREHWFAMVIAVLAASLGHWYTNSANSNMATVTLEPHDHLRSFQRLANVSFCPLHHPLLQQQQQPTTGISSRLQVMDFFLSPSQLEVLELSLIHI